MSQVAPCPLHQHDVSAVHHPGSPVLERTHCWGITFQLHTSPPHAWPLPMQSVSIMHFMPWLNGSVEPMVLDGATVPPPLTLLIMPILFVDSSVNQMFLSGPSVMPSGSLSGVGTGYSEMPPVGVTRAIA